MFGKVVQNVCGRIETLLAEDHTAFTQAEIDEVKDLLIRLSKKSSSELKGLIGFLLGKLEEKNFLRQFGVYIIED